MTHIHLPSMISATRRTRWLTLLGLALAFALLAGCAQTGQMRDQPRYNPLAASDFFPDGRSSRNPQPGTVPYSETQSPNDPALTGVDTSGAPLKNLPVQADQALVQQGQDRFNIYCVPCHGVTGEGNGKVTQFQFPKPPSLLADNAKGLTNGDIFNIITNGRGKMFPYGYRVKPAERWAVIAYVRALQLKNGKVTVKDLTPADLQQIGGQP